MDDRLPELAAYFEEYLLGDPKLSETRQAIFFTKKSREISTNANRKRLRIP
jgi:hypothetical protein